MGAAWCRDRRKGGKILLAVGISPALKRHMVAHKARTRISMAEQVEAALLAYLPPSPGYDPPVQYARARRPSISWSVISDIGSSAGSRVGRCRRWGVDRRKAAQHSVALCDPAAAGDGGVEGRGCGASGD
jgi:hypothetical protein